MTRPVVAIGADLVAAGRRDRAYSYTTYVDSLRRAGLVAVVLPPQLESIDDALEAVDGIVLAGGYDYDPAVFGETRHPSVEPMDPRRQEHELALARAARQRRVPALGICLGMQSMAVAAGGKLIQDIPSYFEDAVTHSTEAHDRLRHDVKIDAGTRLAAILGSGALNVNSSHHQAVRTAGEGLIVTAHAPDGIIEALEDPAHPFYLGVQWHPEEMEGEASADALFRAFAEAATAYRNGRGA